MADVHDPAARSRNMRAIRNKDTKPELKLRGILAALGHTFELHARDLPGTPDLVLRDHHIAIFMNGCFWHGHDCYLFRMPEARRDFWQPKIEKTRERDMVKWEALLNLEWRVLVVWECSVKGRLRQTEESLAREVEEWIGALKNSPRYRFHSLRCLPNQPPASSAR
jgi:DNA mismatch endonuclease, patch repair protein